MKKLMVIGMAILLALAVVGCKGRTSGTSYYPNQQIGANGYQGLNGQNYNQYQQYYQNGQTSGVNSPWDYYQNTMVNSPGAYVGQNQYGLQQGYYNGYDMWQYMQQNYWYFAQNQMQHYPQFQGMNPQDPYTFLQYQQQYMPFVSPYQGCSPYGQIWGDQFSLMGGINYNEYNGWSGSLNMGGAYNNCF